MTRADIKALFQTDDIPTQANFESFIDAVLNLAEDTLDDVPQTGTQKTVTAAEKADYFSKANDTLDDVLQTGTQKTVTDAEKAGWQLKGFQYVHQLSRDGNDEPFEFSNFGENSVLVVTLNADFDIAIQSLKDGKQTIIFIQDATGGRNIDYDFAATSGDQLRIDSVADFDLVGTAPDKAYLHEWLVVGDRVILTRNELITS